MKYLKNILEKQNIGQFFLCILFIIYLIFNVKTPKNIAKLIDTNIGKIVVLFLAILLFFYSNPILGIIGLIVAFEIIKRSSITTGNFALSKYYPTEEKKWSPFTPHHQFPYTLEQEIVKKMAPIRKANYDKKKSLFKPILDDLHNASPVDYDGVI